MAGWFNLFRENGGPTLYASSNRTPVVGDVSTITLCVVFGTLYLAFFIIFPGIRKERFTTFLSVTLSLFVGTAILIGNTGSSWHLAEVEINSAYKAFSNEKIMGKMGVYVGLSHVNVTLDAMPVYYNKTMDVHFNERFTFAEPTQLADEYRAALKKGLPFPILTVAEYLSVDAEGFCWGRNYRKAGYYTTVYLWAAFVLWVCMNVLLVVVPRYGAYAMALTGGMMLFSNVVYLWLLPQRHLVIHIEDAVLTFGLGWCFYLILIAGGVCLAVGGSISILDLIYPHKFSTILEMDYGTPFDRHTIIEDSHETKKKKKTVHKLEEPATVGFGGILRRLSKRDRYRPSGNDNYAFEMEAPKSPWRYPHLMFRSDSSKKKYAGKRHLEIPGMGAYRDQLRRTDSRDSNTSSASGMHGHHQGAAALAIASHNQALREDLRAVFSVPPFQDQFGMGKKFRRADSSDSNSSFGNLSSILSSRNNSRKKRRNPPHNPRAHFERGDSGQSVISRGFTVQQTHPELKKQISNHSSHSNVSGNSGHSGNSGNSDLSNHSERAVGESASVVVSGRKNSTTTAVRRNSGEHQRAEASMW